MKHHYESEWCAKRLICYFQGQGHCKSSWSKFYCYFWTTDTFATRLGLIICYHKPECFMEKFDCCVQGQGHSKISKCQWMFVQMTFSESLNLLLLPNLVWWCIIISQNVLQKDWFAVFKVKVTITDNIIKICLFDILSELLILLQLNLVWWHIIISWIVLWKDWIALLQQGQGQRKVQNSSECSSGCYLLSCCTFCNQTWYGDATS